MACVLKLVVNESKGVVTFTTQEWRVISQSKELLEKLTSLRSKYVTGLHFNWHDFAFSPPPLFDFFMAGEEDLKPTTNATYNLLPMDACNFTPACYSPGQVEKFWDVLAIGNPVFFKRPEQVLRTIRQLFDDAGRYFRILYICPIPAYRFADEDTVLYDVREYYESLFSPEERQWFTLLTTEFDSPNPFDRTTLSVFFKNSKVFLHCATEERRCRIAAYAWCAGLPVVAYPSVASILPEDLRNMPGYFQVDEDAQYSAQLRAAIDASSAFNSETYRQVLSETYTVQQLESRLRKLFDEKGFAWEGAILDRNLDRRLGWHHQGIGGSSNGLQQSLGDFMSFLENEKLSFDAQNELFKHDYPERVIAGEFLNTPTLIRSHIEKKSVYLNHKKKRWLRFAKSLKSRIF